MKSAQFLIVATVDAGLDSRGSLRLRSTVDFNRAVEATTEV